MSIEANKETARRFTDAISRGGVDLDILSDDFVHWSAMGGELNRAQLVGGMDYVVSQFVEPFTIYVDSMIGEGNRVAMEAHSEGELLSGALYRNRYHFLFEFAPDGRIRRVNEHMDSKHAVEVMSAPATQG
jgi:ketosteroid isomerase-like protein